MVLIELKNISKTYGSRISKTVALKDINFSADPGKLITITGPSSSGKSTFLKIIGGILSPTNGKILINNTNYEQLSKQQKEQFRLNQIGFILQAYNLLPYLKVKDQFELTNRVKPNDNLSSQQFQQIVDELGIGNLMDHYPDELSGGQQQRIAIAKAFYSNPKIILADEPTAALDGQKSVQVMEAFRHLAHDDDKLVLVITHDARLIKYADANYQIVDGQGQFVSIEQTELV